MGEPSRSSRARTGDHEALHGRVRGVEHDQLGQQAGDEARERLGERRPRPVALRHDRERLVAAEGGRESLAELLDERRDRVVEGDRPRRLADRLVARGVAQGADRPPRVDHARRADLREVVVVGGHPEDRHDGAPAFLLEEPGDLDRRQGLPEDEERPAEETGLLAGHDRGRPGSGEGAGPLGRPPRSARLLLARERLGHRRRRPLEGTRPLGRAGDRREVDAARPEEGAGALLPGQVVEEERGERLVESVVRQHFGRLLEHASEKDSTSRNPLSGRDLGGAHLGRAAKACYSRSATGECRQRSSPADR